MADENRRKRDTEFRSLPKAAKPLSLAEAFQAGEVVVRKLVADMLGSLRFSEVVELNVLWQRASRSETITYERAQSVFRQLLGSANTGEAPPVRQAAETVRKALALAGVSVLPHGDS